MASDLQGKILVRKFDSGNEHRFRITDVKAYRGSEDKACHASRGPTAHTELLYDEGGKIYVYLIYGMYWLQNLVTGDKDKPQGVMIRGLEGIYGPGRVGRALKLDRSFRGISVESEILWVEDSGEKPEYVIVPRVGID